MSPEAAPWSRSGRHPQERPSGFLAVVCPFHEKGDPVKVDLLSFRRFLGLCGGRFFRDHEPRTATLPFALFTGQRHGPCA